jgi:PAS domain S-box-containing protein
MKNGQINLSSLNPNPDGLRPIKRLRTRWFSNGYVVGILAASALLIVLLALRPVFDGSPPLLLLLLAVTLATWHGGFSAGLLTLALCALASDYFLVEPYYSWSITDYGERVRMGLLVGVGGVLSLVIALLRKAERQALQAALEREEALRQSEAHFRAMAETVPDILFTRRSDGRSDYVNPRFYEYTGLPPGAAEGFDWMDALPPEDREQIRTRVQQSVETGEPYAVMQRLRAADGRYRWFRVQARPIRNDEGRILRWFGVCSDIDDLIHAQEALQEADRRKDEFLAMLGHELRNPLAPIRTAVQVMNRVVDPADPKQLWAREVIGRQVEHLVRLVDDLLDVSRIVQGKLTLNKVPVEVATVIEQAIETTQPLIEARHHAFTVVLPDEPIRVEGDSLRLAQVVANLLANAAKYTPEGGRIWLTVTCGHGEAVIAVRDTGEGIAGTLLPRLFEVFTQAERTLDRAQGGLGLGLTIVRNIVELHGGRVEAYSEGVGKGSEFVVRLPIHEPSCQPRLSTTHG